MQSRFNKGLDAAILLFLAWTAVRLLDARIGSRVAVGTAMTIPPAALSIGDAFSLGTADLAERQLIIAISQRCAASSRSLPLYRSIDTLRRGGAYPRFRLVALTAEPKEQVDEWLRQNGITVDRVVQVPTLYALGFEATPTLMLVDSSQRITDLAMGGLTKADEDRLLERLAGRASIPLNKTFEVPTVGDAELQALLRKGGVILDIRERPGTPARKQVNAIHMPVDEFSERLLAEVDPSIPVIVDCRAVADFPCDAAVGILLSEYFSSVFALRK